MWTIVEQHFQDDWVVAWAPGLLADLAERATAWQPYLPRCTLCFGGCRPTNRRRHARRRRSRRRARRSPAARRDHP